MFARFLASLMTLTLLILLFPLAYAQVPLELTTNKTEYSLGDQVVVSGTTRVNSAVTIIIFNPFVELVGIAQAASGADGNFEVAVFTFPLDFTEKFPPGEYIVSAQVEGASAEVTIVLEPDAPPPVIGEIVEVEQTSDRYVFITKNNSIRYKIEVFKNRPEMTVVFESSPGFFNDSNKVRVELTHSIEFIDTDSDQLYTRGTDTDVSRTVLSSLSWTAELLNNTVTRYEYQVTLTAVDGVATYRIDITIIGGELVQRVTYEISGFVFAESTSLLALMIEGRGETELEFGPREIGLNRIIEGGILSPFYSLNTFGRIDGIGEQFASRITEEDADDVQAGTEKIMYITVPRFETSASHQHNIGVRVGAPVPEFASVGAILTLAVLIPFVILLGRKGRKARTSALKAQIGQ